MPKPKIYLAGKIGKNDWRHFLVPGLRNCEWKDCPVDAVNFQYVGPFFVACDHGCNHGPNQHGAAAGHSICESLITQRDVIRNNNYGLAQADLVFAYINSVDCFGTLVEIGMAINSGQRVVIAFAPGIPHPEFWYAALQAKSIYHEVRECCLQEILRKELEALV